MIYTLTLNPSLDYIIKLDDLELGQTNRSYDEKIYPGGKGFNVSTILQRLSIDNTALGFVGGFTGKQIEDMLKDRGIDFHLCHLTHGVSRINVKIKGKEETEINANGPDISSLDLEHLFDQIKTMNNGDYLIMAGSVPSSLPQDIYSQIIERLKDKDIEFIIDTNKNLLLNVLIYQPFLIKPNLAELEELFHVNINTREEIINYANKLREKGAKNVLVSLGKDGAILVTEEHVYLSNAANGKLINSVGSGDSMVAGFVAGYTQTDNFEWALKLASACGGATAFSDDLATKEMIDHVLKDIEVKILE